MWAGKTQQEGAKLAETYKKGEKKACGFGLKNIPGGRKKKHVLRSWGSCISGIVKEHSSGLCVQS